MTIDRRYRVMVALTVIVVVAAPVARAVSPTLTGLAVSSSTIQWPRPGSAGPFVLG